MKRKLIYIFTLLLSCVTFFSCDLESDIYTAIDMDRAFGSAQDIENALNGAYMNLGHYPYRGNRIAAIGDMASDLTEADASKGHFVSINMWTFSDTDGNLLDAWEYAYKVIDSSTRGINGSLSLLSAPENLPQGDDMRLKSAMSQFYALRALAHFDLVNLFGLPYRAGTSNTQPGIVIINKEPVKEFQEVSRSSVEDVYKHILADIQKAKEYVVAGSLGQYYFNEAAIYALEARVHLYMQDYSKAITSAQKAIDLRKSGGVDNDSYISMWSSTAITGEDIFTLVKSEDDNLSANSLNTLYGSYGGKLSQFTISKFDAKDIRLNLIDVKSGHPKKFDGLPSASAVGNVPVFRLSEMYLIIAEAQAQQSDIAAAQNALFFTAKRNLEITDAKALPTSKDELLQFIADERIREFFTEGHRFYDLRRTGAVATIGGDDNFIAAKFVFPIPSQEVNSGFGVTQNVDWNKNLPKPKKDK